MNIDELFIETLADLEKRMNSDNDYEVLRAAALLRQLLLDDNRLIDQVNRTRHEKIKFVINNYDVPKDDNLSFWSIEDGIDPDRSNFGHIPKEVKRDQLLSCVVLKAENHFFTVKELIQHMANVQGAIHHDDLPKNEKDRILALELEPILTGIGVRIGFRLLRVISKIVFKGLIPLRDIIQS